jgi:hypothetical protein
VKEVIKFESNSAKLGVKPALACYGSDYQ